MAEFGLQIEIHTGEDGDQQITTNVSAIDGVGFNTSLQSNEIDTSRKTRRRASFHSLYDADDEKVKSQAVHLPSRASSAQDTYRRDSRGSHRLTRANLRASGGITQGDGRPQSSIAQLRRSRLTEQGYTNNLHHSQRRPSEATKTHSRRHNQVLSEVGVGDQADQDQPTFSRHQSSNFDGSEPQEGDVSAGFPQQHPASYTLAPQELLYRPSETQLIRDADTFEHYRTKAVTRTIINRWSEVASQAEKDHREMEQFAINHDSKILLQQGFDQWRMRLRERRRFTETERFFNQLENRAGRARDLFLLTKAFTHWAECAREEVSRTSKARHHILRLKYFHAWRDITVVNELKVRRQGLQKFFDIWKHRCIQNLTDEARAVSQQYHSILKTAFWGLFWAFCEKRAPEWRVARLRTKYFRIWLDKHRKIAQQESRVIIYSQDSRRKVFSQWLQKARTSMCNTQEALSINQQRLKTNSMHKWRLTRQHTPLARQISNMVDWRVAGNTFSIFVARFRTERLSERVNRLRILRSLWKQWNDRLRLQALSQKIDDRFLLEALYKWVIVERARLLQRLTEQRLMQRNLSALSNYFVASRAQRTESLQRFQQSRNVQLLRSMIIQWRNRLEAYREEQRAAVDFYDPRIARESLQVWNCRRVHLQTLEVWADDSDYYFLGNKALKRWQAAMVESKRRKRRDAYALIRRKLKMDLAGKIIGRWQSLTAMLQDQDQQAQIIYQSRLLGIGSSLFDNWRSRSEHAVNQSNQAAEYFQQSIATVQFRTWCNKSRDHQDLHERAQQFSNSLTEKDAFRWLQKLRLQMIERQGRVRNADSLRALHVKRHLHSLIRRWHSELATRRGLPQRRETARSSRARRFGFRLDPDEDLLAARGADEWTQIEAEGFDPSDGLSPPPPPINYLSTPSKRPTIKPRSQELSSNDDDFSTTPIGTPIVHNNNNNNLPPKTPAAPPIFQRGGGGAAGALRSRAGVGGGITPFQRRLRIQQINTEPPPPPRRLLTGRSSALGQFVLFKDVDEAAAEAAATED